MVRRSKLILMATVGLIWTTSLLALDVAGYRIALPADCKVTVRWVSPPLDPNQIEQAHWWWNRVRFDVDASGMPWFAIREDFESRAQILNPVKHYRFGLSHPFEGMVCLDNGALLFNTDHDLGSISVSELDFCQFCRLGGVTELVKHPVPELRG
jgi:hypothetical protein